jgi:hypothetical protein
VHHSGVGKSTAAIEVCYSRMLTGRCSRRKRKAMRTFRTALVAVACCGDYRVTLGTECAGTVYKLFATTVPISSPSRMPDDLPEIKSFDASSSQKASWSLAREVPWTSQPLYSFYRPGNCPRPRNWHNATPPAHIQCHRLSLAKLFTISTIQVTTSGRF